MDSGLGEGLIEDPGEDPSQLVCKVLQNTSCDAVRTRSFPGVDGPQRAPHFMLLDCEGEAAVDCGV